MIYLCQTWGQSKTGLFNKIEKLQDKALRIIRPLKILKSSDYISFQNALLVKNYFENQLPQPLLNFFKKTTKRQNHSKRSASKNFAFVEKANSNSYGIDSVRYQPFIIWNKYKIT